MKRAFCSIYNMPNDEFSYYQSSSAELFPRRQRRIAERLTEAIEEALSFEEHDFVLSKKSDCLFRQTSQLARIKQ